MDKKKFEQFYHEHLDKIYRFVFFRVGAKRELAEDLTTEIFIKALEHFGKYDENKSKSAWIFTIARNHLYNHFRDNRRVEISLEALDESLYIEVESQGQDSTGLADFLQKDSERELWAILNELPEDKRKLVTLKHLYGYSYDEIGEMTGISPGAAKVAVHRVMKDLQSKLSTK